MKPRVGLYVALGGLATTVICLILLVLFASLENGGNRDFAGYSLLGCLLSDAGAIAGVVILAAGLLLAGIAALWPRRGSPPG